MKQQLFDEYQRGKTLWEIHHDKNPTIWECGRKYDPISDSFNEVNGKPEFKRQAK